MCSPVLWPGTERHLWSICFLFFKPHLLTVEIWDKMSPDCACKPAPVCHSQAFGLIAPQGVNEQGARQCPQPRVAQQVAGMAGQEYRFLQLHSRNRSS